MTERFGELTQKHQNLYENLWRQVEKIFDWRTYNQGRRGTERYREGARAFSKHLAKAYGSQNFKNISDKHLRSFVEDSKEAGIGTSTIKTDLAAIRRMHRMLPKKRYDLTFKNKEIGAEQRQIKPSVDRAWRPDEVRAAVVHAENMGRQDVSWAIRITSSLGTRLEEVTALTRTQLRDAIQDGYVALTNTKGGIARDVPLNTPARHVFSEILRTPGNERIFITHGRVHHQAMYRIQHWIGYHRGTFTKDDSDQRGALTFHGLRHAYARQQFEARKGHGVTERRAKLEVAHLLGHGRDQVTNIYLNQ